MNEYTYEHFVRLIGLLAQDVFSERTLMEHIDEMALPVRVHTALLQEVSDAYGFEQSGYDHRRAYVEDIHRVLGYPHLRLIEDLRNHAYNRAPDKVG